MATVAPTKSGKRARSKKRGLVKPRAVGRHSQGLRWGRIFLAGMLLLALLLGFAPSLTGWFGLQNAILASVMPELNGSAQFDSTELGWFAPVVLQGGRITDSDGEVVANVARIETEKTLLSLLIDSTDLGIIELHQVKLFVHWRSDGSNIEDVLRPLLDSDDQSEPITMDVRFHDSTITFNESGTFDESGGDRQWKMEKIEAAVVGTPHGKHPYHYSIEAQLPNGTKNGTLAAKFDVENVDQSEQQQYSIKWNSKTLPLDLVEVIWKRFDPHVRLRGQLDSELEIHWASDPNDSDDWSILADINAKQLELGLQTLSKDVLRLDQLNASAKVDRRGDQIHAQAFELNCDLAQLSAEGKAPAAIFKRRPFAEILSAVTCSIQGRVDLARLAAALPETMRIRQDTTIESGEMRLAIEGRHDRREKHWTGEISVGPIRANRMGADQQKRPIHWEQPLQIDFDVALAENGLRLAKLTCRSEFITLSAEGTPDKLRGDGKIDLGGLHGQLAEIMDLRDWSVAGNGTILLDWQRGADQLFRTFAEMRLNGLRVRFPDGKMWQEPTATFRISTTGKMQDRQLKSIYTMSTRFQTPRDHFLIQLVEPVYQVADDTTWRLKLDAEGPVANWMDRLRPWLTTDEIELTGMATARAEIEYDPKGLRFVKGDLAIQEARLRGPSFSIAEPNVSIEFQDVMQLASGEWTAAEVLVGIATSAKIRARELQFAGGPTGTKFSGWIDFAADLRSTTNWFTDTDAQGVVYQGILKGGCKFESAAESTDLDLNLDIQNLQIREPVSTVKGQSPKILLSEPRAQFTLRGTFDSTLASLKISALNLQSSAMTISARGACDDLFAKQRLRIDGNIEYDWQRLGPLLQNYLGQGFVIAGKQQHKFTIAGELRGEPIASDNANPGGATLIAAWRKNLQMNTTIGWQSAKLYGLPVGEGTIRFELREGTLSIRPSEIELSEGKFSFAPYIKLSSEPPLLILPTGKVLENVRITPQMCASGLKYVHPFLSGATALEGTVSLELRGGRVPLSDTKKTNLAGILHIEKVRVAGGPIAQQLFPLISALPAQKVPLTPDVEFWIADERVYHRGVGAIVGNTTIRTQGSIGFDDTLDIVAELPIPDQWLAKIAGRAGLRGKIIRVPIRGTLDKPKIDLREFKKMQQQLLRDAAGDVLKKQLLDRLFK